MSPSAVNILVTEPMRKIVSAVTGRRVSRSITPKPPTHSTLSRDTIAIPTPGIACSRRVASILSSSGCRSWSAAAASGDSKKHRITSESQRMGNTSGSVKSMEWPLQELPDGSGRRSATAGAKVVCGACRSSTTSDSTPNRRMSGGARSSGLSPSLFWVEMGCRQNTNVAELWVRAGNPRRESTSSDVCRAMPRRAMMRPVRSAPMRTNGVAHSHQRDPRRRSASATPAVSSE